MSGYDVSQPFHLAFPVHDLAAARRFYGELLGCPEGRSADDWVDFNLYGHQIVAHLAPEEVGHRATSQVDGDAVPVRHFGVVLSPAAWQALADRLTARRLTLDVTAAARDWLALNGFDPVYGARPLRRLVQSAIGDQLAKELLAGEVRDGDTVRVDVLDDNTGLIVGRSA